MVLENYYMVCSCLFVLGLCGILLHRKNILILLMAIELMLLAVNLSFIGTSVNLEDLQGQVVALYVLVVAASESAIGLALLVAFFGVRGSIGMSHMQRMQG